MASEYGLPMKNRQSLSDNENPRRHYYKGNVAAQYDKERADEKKWQMELDIIRRIVTRIEPDASILDVPLGTGRFLAIYERRGVKHVVGIDISEDMLLQARQRQLEEPGRYPASMIVGDAENLPIKNQSVDYVVCIRFLNWLSGDHFNVVLAECQRVARRGLIIGVRVYSRLSLSNLIQLRSPHLEPALRHALRSVRSALEQLATSTGHLDFSSKRQPFAASDPPYDNERNEFKFHGDIQVLDLFRKNGLRISRQFSFDVRWDDHTKLVLPYRIYFLEL
jgi:ubiquinone/menaquinone biosynthesis C-methylase UbiE